MKKLIKKVGLKDNDDINEINKKLEEYAKEEDKTFINTHELLVDEGCLLNEGYMVDSLHLNDEGYEFVSNTLIKYLK